MESTFRYGQGHLTARLDAGECLGVLTPQSPEPSGTDLEIVARALADPFGSPPLRELARGRRSAAILIPGKARRAGTDVYVRALIEELNAGGIGDEGIAVFLADGTHVQHLESDVADLLGEDVRRRVRCLGHDCRDASLLTEVGRTSRGNRVLINRQVLEADVRVLTGRIVPHYFAGYSGGRKALIPGVAGFETIKGNHRLTLADRAGIHAGAQPCRLAHNPVHEDMLEAARMVAPEFSLNTLLDTEHRIVGAAAGAMEAAHEAGCALAERWLRVEVDQPADAAITCAGGLPYDMNFMQSLKAPFNVRSVVRPGGAMLWIGEAAGGMHEGFTRWAAIDSDEKLDRAVRTGYQLTGHNSIMLRALVRQCRVAMVSALPSADVAALGIEPCADLEQGLAWLERQFDGPFGYYVIPHANVMCATVRS